MNEAISSLRRPPYLDDACDDEGEEVEGKGVVEEVLVRDVIGYDGRHEIEHQQVAEQLVEDNGGRAAIEPSPVAVVE